MRMYLLITLLAVASLVAQSYEDRRTNLVAASEDYSFDGAR